MAVDVQGHRGIGAPQPLRHDLNGLPCGYWQQGVGMPWGVGPGALGELDLGDDWTPDLALFILEQEVFPSGLSRK